MDEITVRETEMPQEKALPVDKALPLNGQVPVNRMVRVLTEQRLKFTVRIVMKSGKVFEIQADRLPSVDWIADARELWVSLFPTDDYTRSPVCRASEVEVIFTEANVT